MLTTINTIALNLDMFCKSLRPCGLRDVCTRHSRQQHKRSVCEDPCISVPIRGQKVPAMQASTSAACAQVCEVRKVCGRLRYQRCKPAQAKRVRRSVKIRLNLWEIKVSAMQASTSEACAKIRAYPFKSVGD